MHGILCEVAKLKNLLSLLSPGSGDYSLSFCKCLIILTYLEHLSPMNNTWLMNLIWTFFFSSQNTFPIILGLFSYEIKPTSVVKLRFFLFVFISKYVIVYIKHILICRVFWYKPIVKITLLILKLDRSIRINFAQIIPWLICSVKNGLW